MLKWFLKISNEIYYKVTKFNSIIKIIKTYFHNSDKGKFIKIYYI